MLHVAACLSQFTLVGNTCRQRNSECWVHVLCDSLPVVQCTDCHVRQLLTKLARTYFTRASAQGRQLPKSGVHDFLQRLLSLVTWENENMTQNNLLLALLMKKNRHLQRVSVYIHVHSDPMFLDLVCAVFVTLPKIDCIEEEATAKVLRRALSRPPPPRLRYCTLAPM